MSYAGMGGGLLAAGAAAGGLAARYVRGRSRVEAAAVGEVGRRLTDIGEVDSLSVLPLVERLVARPDLRGEPGVCYLLRADDVSLIFDCGLGHGGDTAPLASNAEVLGVTAETVSAVVISHLHLDHVGGPGAQLRRTFAIPTSLLLPKGVPAFVPTAMTHPGADVSLITGPRVITRGVAVLPPLGRMLFWPGAIAEQALVVNVRGFGLVLVTGCGHPRIETMLAAAERALDVPVRAVIGGLHLPVHPLGTPLLPQALLGNPNWPWRPINEADVRAAIDTITELGPALVAVSSHDSTAWTFEEFAAAFGSRYRTLRVGEPLVVSAITRGGAKLIARPGDPTSPAHAPER